MTKHQKYKCPVCGAISEAHKNVGNSIMQCSLCHATDSTSQFKPVDTTPTEHVVAQDGTEMLFDTNLADGTTLRQYYPPQEIVDAVDKIHTYFTIGRGAKEWAYGPIRSRDPVKHPALESVGLTGFIGKDIRLEDVQRLAAAFQSVVIKHPTKENLEKVTIWIGDTFLDEGNLQGDATAIVDGVLRAVGLL